METFTAVFDGKVLVPEEPVNLSPNSRVRVTVSEPMVNEDAKTRRREALARLLQRPAHGGGYDWAEWDRGDVYP